MSSTLQQRLIDRQNSIDNRELLIAAGNGIVNDVKSLISKGADVNFVDKHGNSALHYAVEKKSLGCVHLLLNNMGNVNIENNNGDTPFDVYEESSNEDMIYLLGKHIVDSSQRFLENSYISTRTVDKTINSGLGDSDQSKTDVQNEIENTELRMESCLDYLSKICDEIDTEQANGINSKTITFKQANVFVQFLETFALQGLGKTKKDRLTKYFEFYWTQSDRIIISEARTILFKKAKTRISLNDVQKFVRTEDMASFFNGLRTYVEKVRNMLKGNGDLKQLFLLQHMLENMLENKRDFDLTAELEKFSDAVRRYRNELAENRIFSYDEMSSLLKKFKPFLKMETTSLQMQTMLEEIKDFFERKDQLKNESRSPKNATKGKRNKKSRSQEKVEKSESQSESPDSEKVRCDNSNRISLLQFMNALNDKTDSVGEETDVETLITEEFQKLINIGYGEQNDLQERLFNFATNLYPAIDSETKRDFEKLCKFRNLIIHESFKYGCKEFEKELQNMKSILFRYYFAREIHKVLKGVKANEPPEAIRENLQCKLDDFKKEFWGLNKKVIIREDEPNDDVVYKFSEASYLKKDYDSGAEKYVHQYLSFMTIIDNENREQEYLMDTDGDNRQNEQSQYQELNDAKRREIFENFDRLRRLKICEDVYHKEKRGCVTKLMSKYPVNEEDCERMYTAYIKNGGNYVERNATTGTWNREKELNSFSRGMELNETQKKEILEIFRRLKRSETCKDAYVKEREKFKMELVDRYGIDAVHFDHVYRVYIENKEEQFAQRNDATVKEIVKAVHNLKKIKDQYKLSSQDIISLYDQLLKRQGSHNTTIEKTLSGVKLDVIEEKIAKEFPENSTLNIAVGNHRVRLQTSKVISNILKIFYTEYHEFQAEFNIQEIFNDSVFLDCLIGKEKNEEKGGSSFRTHGIIKKLIEIEFCAPYVVRLIKENTRAEVIEQENLIKLLEILLKKQGGSYMKHLHLLLNETDDLDLYSEVCRIIFEQDISIESMNLIFRNPKCVEEILSHVKGRISLVDNHSGENKMLEVTKRILKLLKDTSYELYKDENYEHASKILDNALDVYEKLRSHSLIEESEPLFLMARYRRARIKNRQGKMMIDLSERENLFKEAYEEFKSIRVLGCNKNSQTATEKTIPNREIPIFWLALSDIAHTQHLLGEYEKSNKAYENLCQEVIKFTLDLRFQNNLPGRILDPATYNDIQKSERYRKILAFSDESKKYLDILNIMISIAYNMILHGEKQKTEIDNSYKGALKIYRAVYYYKKKNGAVSRISIVRTLRQISNVSNKIAWYWSNRGGEYNRDRTVTIDCYKEALYWFYFTLLRNNVVYTMQNEIYWPSHPAVACTTKNIIKSICSVAFVYNRIGSKKPREERCGYHRIALDTYLEIDKVLSNGFGENEDLTCKVKKDIAHTYKELHDETNAKRFLEKAFDIQKKILGENDPKTLETKEKLKKIG